MTRRVMVLVVLAGMGSVARADEPGKCVGTAQDGVLISTDCNASSSSSSSSNPQMDAAIAAEKAERARVEAENQQRRRAAQHVSSVREANESGVQAVRAKQFAKAIALFERALQLSPDSSLARSNLEEARRAQEAEIQRVATERANKQRADELEKYRQARQAEQKRLSKFLKNGMVVPPPGSGPSISVGAALSDKQPIAWPDATQLIDYTLQAIGDRTKDEAMGVLDDTVDVMTPWGYFVRVEMQVSKVATDFIPDALTAAVRDNTIPNTLEGATMIFNVGTGPGDILHEIAKVGSAGKVLLDRAEQQTTRFLTRQIETLSIKAGAAMTSAGKSFERDARALLHDLPEARAAAEQWIRAKLPGPSK